MNIRPLTQVISHRFGMLVCSLVLAHALSISVSAGEIAGLQLALRPEGIGGVELLDAPPPVNQTPHSDDRLLREEYRPNGSSGPPQPAPAEKPESLQAEITARYQDPRMLSYVSGTTVNQTMSLYLEASRLIDTRHVSPVSYEVRTRRAIESLIAAVENPEFLRAAGANPTSQAVAGVQEELRQLLNTQPARSANEALGLMQWATDLIQQRLGVRPQATAVEFVNGTIDALDKYSAFVPARTGTAPGAALEERIVGIGVELKKHDDGVQVQGVVDGSPAQEAGLQKGDVIVRINGQVLGGMSLSQAADLISGPAGTPVLLNVSRGGRPFTISLRRRSVYVSSVVGARMLDRQVGYVRLKHFSESSAEDLEKAMWSLFNNGMETLVLDLRGNPGGLLTESVQLSNLFLPCGRIVSTRGRTAADNMDEQAQWTKTWKIPLVVLVDENSASASEIFAAAIQDNGRGVIVGQRTYGKGTVQTHFPLQSVAGELKLTTAKFYSPTGREMAGAGVTPDVAVAKSASPDESNLLNDAEITTALRVAQSGRPAELAAGAAKCRLQNNAIGYSGK